MEILSIKPEVFKNAFQSGDLKQQVYRFSVGGKNGAFQKRLRHNSLCQPRQYRWRYWYMRIEQKNVRAEPGQWKQKRIFGSSRGRSKP